MEFASIVCNVSVILQDTCHKPNDQSHKKGPLSCMVMDDI